MGREDFVRAGLGLEYDQDSQAPQIPYVQDVLYIMHLAGEEKFYDICLFRHPTYVANTLLIATAVAHEIAGPKRVSRTDMHKAVAQTIMDLCPANARCLRIPGFAQAKSMLGLVDIENRRPAELARLCGCARCEALKAKKELKKRAS